MNVQSIYFFLREEENLGHKNYGGQVVVHILELENGKRKLIMICDKKDAVIYTIDT